MWSALRVNHNYKFLLNLKNLFYRFFTEEECIGTCKDAKRTNKKKGVCPHAAPICQPGCVLGKGDEDQGTCLTCICNKNAGKPLSSGAADFFSEIEKMMLGTRRNWSLPDVLRDKREQVVSGHCKKVTPKLLWQSVAVVVEPLKKLGPWNGLSYRW